MSASKVAGVYRHEKCSWFWLEKRMMAMTRCRVAVGQTEEEIFQQLREDSPVVDSCEGALLTCVSVSTFFCFAYTTFCFAYTTFVVISASLESKSTVVVKEKCDG